MLIFVGSTVWRIFEKGDRSNYWVVKEKDDCLLVTASPFGGAVNTDLTLHGLR